MIEMTLEEQQAETLVLLKRFHKICEERSLRYSLGYGSLLGAIRHDGPIPWDDDVDVVMPRPDYEELISMGYDDGFCFIADSRRDDFHWHYAKMISGRTWKDALLRPEYYGVFLDIFPMDGVDSSGPQVFGEIKRLSYRYDQAFFMDKRRRKVVWDRAKGAKGYAKCMKNSLIGMTTRLRYKQDDLRGRIEALATNCVFDETKKACGFVVPAYSFDRNSIDGEFFSRLVLHDYMDTSLYVFEDYEQVLCNVYGPDWRIPVKNRAHGRAYWL